MQRQRRHIGADRNVECEAANALAAASADAIATIERRVERQQLKFDARAERSRLERRRL